MRGFFLCLVRAAVAVGWQFGSVTICKYLLECRDSKKSEYLSPLPLAVFFLRCSVIVLIIVVLRFAEIQLHITHFTPVSEIAHQMSKSVL